MSCVNIKVLDCYLTTGEHF